MFDPDEYLNMQTDQMSTDYTPIPETEVEAQCTDVKLRKTESDKGVFLWLDTTWEISEPKILQAMDRDRPVSARYSFSLDLDDKGALDTGKGSNVRLGRLRDALGMNNDGFMLSQLKGGIGMVKIRHEKYQDRVTSRVVDVTSRAGGGSGGPPAVG